MTTLTAACRQSPNSQYAAHAHIKPYAPQMCFLTQSSGCFYARYILIMFKGPIQI